MIWNILPVDSCAIYNCLELSYCHCKTMDFKSILFFIVISLQNALSAPPLTALTLSNPTVYGSDLTKEFNKNLGVMLSNLQNGVTSITTPPIKLGIETIPSLLTYGIQTAAEKANKLVEVKQDALSKVVAGVGHALGGGAVLGSSLAGGTLQVLGHGLGVGTNVAQSAVVAGIDLAASVADRIVAGTEMKGNITRATLNAIGDGMAAAGGGITVMSQGLSNVIDAIGERITQRISKAKETVAALLGSGDRHIQNGVLSVNSKAQVSFYSLLNSYLQILVNVQNLFDGIAASINSDSSSPISEEKNNLIDTNNAISHLY